MARRIPSPLLAAALIAVVLGAAAALPCAPLVAACEGCGCAHTRAGASETGSRGCCEMRPSAHGPLPGVAATAPESASRPDVAATPVAADLPPDLFASASDPERVETAPTSLDPPPCWLRDCAFLI